MLEAIFSYNILDYFFVAIIGTIIGSFLNLIITRLPQMLQRQWLYEYSQLQIPTSPITKEPPKTTFNLCWPRSHCPHCKKNLLLRDNIPLISFINLGGCCRSCQQPISKQYPIVEMFTLIMTTVLFYHFGGLNWKMFFACCFTWYLITLSIIDLNTHLLPDILTLSLLWIGLLLSVFEIFTTSNQAIIGAITGYLIMWLPATIFQYCRKKTGMGHGDFKLLAAIGAWVGFIGIANTLLIAVFLAIITHFMLFMLKKITYNQPIPFGPALAIAGSVVLLCGPFITNKIY